MRVTQKKIEQWIREGRGQGHGNNYTPWIKITRRGSPSGGHLEYEYIPQLGRHSHLLAKNELQVALLLLWLGVADLREQFPCWPWAHPHPLYLHPSTGSNAAIWSVGTISCAKRIGVKHPLYPGTKIPYVPTIDLMATIKRHDTVCAAAFAVKPDEKDITLDQRDFEKLAITTEYCQNLSIPWKLISGAYIPHTLATNLSTYIRYSGNLAVELAAKWPQFIDALRSNLSESITIHETLHKIRDEIALPHTVVLTLFRRALWLRETSIDLRHTVVMSAPPTFSTSPWVQETYDYMLGGLDD